MRNSPTLTVVVVGADGLKGLDFGKTSDPYVKVKGPGHMMAESFVQKKTTKPTWSLVARESGLQTKKYVAAGCYAQEPIEFEVWDKNKVLKDELMGRAKVDVAQLADGNEFNARLPLFFRPGDSKHDAQGELIVKITYTDPSIPEELLAQYKKEVDMAEEKLSDLYAAYYERKIEGDTVKSPGQLQTVLKNAFVLNSTVASWQGMSSAEARKIIHEPLLLEVLMQEMFEVLDLDHSNSISFGELLAGLAALSEGRNSEKMLQLRFRATDTDNDGQLTFAEAKRLSGMVLKIVEGALNSALKQTTQKFRDAGCTAADLEGIQSKFKEVLGRSDLDVRETEVLFKFADKDKDGLISMAEYVAFMQDPKQVAARDKEFAKLVQPACYSMGVQLGQAFLELGNEIKARHR